MVFSFDFNQVYKSWKALLLREIDEAIVKVCSVCTLSPGGELIMKVHKINKWARTLLRALIKTA